MQTTTSPTAPTNPLRREIVGVEALVPLLDGRQVPYVNLDNAASTPALRCVLDAVNELAYWYASVHRGTGYKSQVSTRLYEEARAVVAEFVHADPQEDVVIFGKNTTEALNKVAARFPFKPGDIVLTSQMEHHSNDLPWRAQAQVEYAGLRPDGSLDLQDLRQKLEIFSGRVKLVTVTGASNVSGYINPIHEIAALAHAHGALVCIDCAQLAPHRPIDMLPHGAPGHLDFVAISAHKIYAPFGSGALVGPRSFFNQGVPEYSGGGTIELVTYDEIKWSDAPERDEAGSPNVIGAVALAAALRFLMGVGMDAVARHEAQLTRYALLRLQELPGVQVYGSRDPERTFERVGVIPFTVQEQQHGKVAAILGYEGGVGVRDGCFCAHPYVVRLMAVEDAEFANHRQRIYEHDRSDLPGLVRMSFGCYNDESDIDRLVEMLDRILKGKVTGEYSVDRRSGSYTLTNARPLESPASLSLRPVKE